MATLIGTKKTEPAFPPEDFWTLCMLEVLYTIPPRTLAERVPLTLPTIIGDH
jgi:hypothetical protein